MTRIKRLTLTICLCVTACGGATTSPARGVAEFCDTGFDGDLCDGWVRYHARGGTSFALPGAVRPDYRGYVTTYTYAEGDVYFEVLETARALPAGGSDRAVIEGVLGGLGDPERARLDDGWHVTSQGVGNFDGRPTAERVIEIRDQLVRRERMIRAGTTIIRIVTMVRHDREQASVQAFACFERALVLAAPASP